MKAIRLSISGKMKSGKDKFAETVQRIIENGHLGLGEKVTIVHVAQSVYETTEFLLGYKLFGKKIVKKTPFERKSLQIVGCWGRKIFGSNIWLKMCLRKISKMDGHVMVTGVRFPNEVNLLGEAGFKSVYINCSKELRIARGANNTEDVTETALDNFPMEKYSYVIENDNDIINLYNHAYHIVEEGMYGND